jgi:hypothetical protein
MTRAEIVQLRPQEQAKFQCSACGADRGCDCNAPAVEKLAAIAENSRQKQQRYRDRKAALRNAPVDIVEDSPTASADRMREKFAALDDETPFEGIECEGDDEETCWRRGLLYRALNAAGEAAYEDWTKFKVDAELVSAAERAAMAWRETAAYLRRLYRGNTKDT